MDRRCSPSAWRPDLRLICQAFESQAERSPGLPAVSFEGSALSFSELNARSNRLAHHLRRLGVGPEVLVGLAVERSLEMVVGVLGVLKAGGAYVALDPGYPAARLRFMLEDAEPPVLLSQARFAASLASYGAAQQVLLDEDWARIAAEPATNPAPIAGPDNLAYLMYTSGSTGQPKGVQVLHRGLTNFAGEAIRVMEVGPGSRVLQLASLSFDASVLEMLLAMLTGSTLHLVPQQALLSGESLERVLREQRITTLAIPPSLLHTVPFRGEPGADYPDLASIVVGGEACPAATANRWGPGRCFLNAYAPTEATIFVTAERCRGGHVEAPTLGATIRGAELLLLGSRMEPVDAGQVGEIYLGGPCLARGYHRRPALTAERFLPHPSSPEPGARLYRTADLARWVEQPDGGRQPSFAGRSDHQVKVRGVRIELGEIEAALGQHPAVHQVAVLARSAAAPGACGAAPGDQRLVAYFVPKAGAEVPPARELRQFLAARLPAAMVPTAYVRLSAMPITPTGKADREALPPPTDPRAALSSAYRPPRTSTEQALAALWCELLGLEQVGIEDSLFELGGHSLSVAQILARVRRDFAIEVPLGSLFESPTVAALGAAVDAARAQGTAAAASAIPRADRSRPLPLTFPQEQVWFLNRLAPDSIAYAFQFTVRWRGNFVPAIYHRALAEIIRRHEVLRTGFVAVAGHPVQQIHPPFRPRVPVVDLSDLAAAAREPAALAAVRRAVGRPFDPARPPLVAWTHLRLAASDHLTVQVEHHYVHDGWSLAVFVAELKALYLAFAAGEPSPLPELAIQFADYAAWQRDLAARGGLDAQLAWWKERLAHPTQLALPADRPRPKQPSHRGEILRVDLPSELYTDLQASSRRQGLTLFVTSLTAFFVLLHRYSGQRDLLLGSGLANRRFKETEALLGMLVNTVVLRADLGGNPRFGDLAAQVRSMVLGAQEHQDLPFERLVEELAPDRDRSRNPLFQVMFSFHDSPVPDLLLPGLSGELFERHNGSAKVDLNVVVKPQREMRLGGGEARGEMTMVWELSLDLFDLSTIERMWGHYRELLRAVVREPQAPIGSLAMLSGPERQALAAWSGRGASPRSLPVPLVPVQEQVARRAAAAPDAVAVSGGGCALSFGELAAAADRVAHRLHGLGVGREAVVAVLAGRTPEMIAALLGVLEAGAAYLPLDPAYPPDRLAFMLADSRAAALLAEPEAYLGFALGGTPVVWLEAEAAEPPPAAGAFPPAPVEEEGLAYVIYTSGSTGRPKGVAVPHRGLANLVAWHGSAYGVTAVDRATQVASPAFDAAVWEVWPYLAAGASLHLPADELRASPPRLLSWLAAEGITLCFLPTPLAEAVLEEGARAGWPAGLALRAMLTGGDRLHRAPARELPFALVNHYGPTESSVVATAETVVAGAPGAPPIGLPIAGLEARVLDRYGNEQPVGVPGELFVAGAGLARGYLGRPGLTAERFLPHAGGSAGGRWYSTGDLVRRRADGALAFLGRLDHQVKVRGFRVELGEIEQVLTAHPAVREAVVTAVEGAMAGGSPSTRLVGYVTLRQPGTTPAALSLYLRQRLPEHMVPAAWSILPALPLTASGKLDREALPAPEAVDEETAYLAPATAAEELLATLFAEVLGVERVGTRDNFFKLGGHSLAATRLLARVYDALGVEVPLAAVFDTPTVEGLAGVVERVLLDEMGLPDEAGELVA